MQISLSSLTDENLMKLYQQGDYEAFQVLYERHNRKVYNYLLKRLSGDDPVEDIFQNIFVKLHKSRMKYDNKFLFLKWLYTLSRNELLDFLKKPGHLSEEFVEETYFLQDSGLDLDNELQINIDAEKKLTNPEKTALKMRFFGDAEYAEISDRLSLTQSNARKILSRGLSKLREKYRQDPK